MPNHRTCLGLLLEPNNSQEKKTQRTSPGWLLVSTRTHWIPPPTSSDPPMHTVGWMETKELDKIRTRTDDKPKVTFGATDVKYQTVTLARMGGARMGSPSPRDPLGGEEGRQPQDTQGCKYIQGGH